MIKENVLIVGARGSIGGSIARELVDAGYVVTAFSGDATDSEAVLNFISTHTDPIHHLVYSASAPISLKTIDRETRKDFIKHFEVAVVGLLNVTQVLLKAGVLKSVTAIGSTSVLGEPPARLASYTTSKYAMLGLVKSLAHELSTRGIRVNMISPGLTGKGVSKSFPEAIIEHTRFGTPGQKLVTAKDVAKLTREVLEDQVKTGENIPIDGGLNK